MNDNLLMFVLFLLFGAFSAKLGYEYALKKITNHTSVFIYGFLKNKLGWTEERIKKEFLEYTVLFMSNKNK